MHDDVLIALISTIGSILVAYITTRQKNKPTEDDELKKEIEDLKKELREKDKKDEDD
ncbi:hypothetical protein [Limosilactobacillus vaginalis]|uniref:hypothetical protein n=1 Tax=Limosilactobacillus vaginalis TaxID=1633 RepID=UPI002432E00A|nr:hypothetical protein [Limosilactobacillus vaginalis]